MVKPIITTRAPSSMSARQPADHKYIMLAALAPIGGGTLKQLYGRMTPDANTPPRWQPRGQSGTNEAWTRLRLPLSKRTNVYADLGMGVQTRNQQHDVRLRYEAHVLIHGSLASCDSRPPSGGLFLVRNVRSSKRIPSWGIPFDA